MKASRLGSILIAVAGVCATAIASAQDVSTFAKGGGNKGNSTCTAFCNAQFGANTDGANNCIRQATRKTGLCYQCGPGAPSSGLTACSGVCYNLQTSTSHCGSCTTACSGGQTCSSGSCTGGGGGTECGRFDGTNGGTWQLVATPGSYGGFTDYTPSGQTGLYFYDSNASILDAYNVTTGVWTSKGATPINYDVYMGLAWVGGTLYAVSGTDVYAYDIAGDSWSTPLTTVAATASTLATRDGAGHVYAVDSAGELVRYDIAANTVSYPATIPTAPSEPRVAFDACSGKVFVARGYDYGDFYSIDPANSYAVTTLASQPEDYMNDIFCSDRSGHIYAGGDWTIPRTFWKYDIATDTWSQLPDLPSDKGNNGGCTIADDGYLYVYGGEAGPMMRIKLN